MAENRNITYNLTFKIAANVTSPAKLVLQSCPLEWGKWGTEPPNQITATPGQQTTVSFKAMGAACSATGTQGYVEYKGTDAESTVFRLTFDIPYSAANSGNLTGGSDYFDTTGGGVPVSGNSVTVDVTITQVKPTI